MKTVVRLTVAMGLCCGAASVVLAVADQATRQARAVAEKRDKMTALAQVLPAYDPQAELVEKRVTVKDAAGQEREVTFHLLRQAGVVSGIAGECSTNRGYGGRISLLAGLSDEGKIQAMVVLEHRETPGLGAALLERKNRMTLSEVFHAMGAAEKAKTLPPSPFLDQYKGKWLDDSASSGDNQDSGGTDAVSGATRTRQAGAEADQREKNSAEVDAVSGATITSRAVADAVQSLAAAFTAHREDLLKP